MTLDEAEKTIAIWKKYENAPPSWSGGAGGVGFIYSAEHDIVYGGPEPTLVNAEDLAALTELGWLADDDCFRHFV